MKLTLEQVRSMTHGALSVTEENGIFTFRRFTDRQAELYETVNDFRVKVPATSGVRLEFVTDASKFSFDYRINIASSRRFYYFDVFVDGIMMQHFGHEGLAEAASTLTVKLPEGSHRVAVYFPNLAKATLSNLTLDDGATLEPVKKSRRLLCYGDSITQGYDAKYSSQTYANLLADRLDAEMVDQGIGGEVFRPELIDPDMDFDPDIITVAYGTNDWSGQEHDRTVQCANEFYARLRATYPKAKIFAITPIWRAAEIAERDGLLALYRYGKYVRDHVYPEGDRFHGAMFHTSGIVSKFVTDSETLGFSWISSPAGDSSTMV